MVNRWLLAQRANEVTMQQQRPYSVSAITAHIKRTLEGDSSLQDLWVEGEISNWSRSRSGHCYFTIKDANAAIRAVIWRSMASTLTFVPEDGQAVLAHGRVSVYAPQGQYQLYVDALQPTGRGALYAQFEALKARLAAEGLFDSERKRSLEPFPACIGVVTSPTGAALRDILNVLGRRWPVAEVLLAPTLVQGDRAPPQIVAALEALYKREGVDVIVVSRGGGAMEDLWAFNDERVARTIAASPVPVVSGVGHETDYTIADFCADVRAPTPSAAAEIVAPNQAEVRERLAAAELTLAESAREIIQTACRDLESATKTLRQHSPRFRVERDRQYVDGLRQRLDVAGRHHLALLQERLRGAAHRLAGLDPYATLARGYAVVRRDDGCIVRRTMQVSPGGVLTIRVTDGSFCARVESS
jgi:exodeoxyribonuclease VII large subunit